MSKTTTIGLFIPAFLRGKGGAEKVAALLANYLSSQDYKIYIICREAINHSSSYALNENVKIIKNELRHDKSDDLKALNLDLIIGFAMMGFSDEIAMIAKELNVKYVLQECTNPNRMMRLMSEDIKIPYNNLRETFWLRQALYAQSNGVRLTNPAYKNSIIKHTHYKTHAFYNSLVGLDIKRQSSEQKEKRTTFNIVTVGAFKNKNKNGLAALEGFINATKDERLKVKMQFHAYGENNFEKEVSEPTRDMAQPDIVFHGISSDINEIYADKDLIILPSYEEGMPNVILEAMTFGIPVIAYDDCAGADDIINASKCGVLISRNNKQNLVDAILENTDSEVASARSLAGLEYAKDNFSEKVWQDNWEQVIEQAIEMPNQYTEKPEQYTKGDYDAYRDILEYRKLSAARIAKD